MATQGDKILDAALANRRQGLFTKELEAQMLVGHADIAAFLKDLPTNLPNGLKLGCITKRENPQML